MKLDRPAKFDLAHHMGYYELRYSHLKCWRQAQKRRKEKATG